MMLEPRPSISSCTRFFAPLPIATSTTTADTPTTTPNIVRALRSLLTRSASSATRNDSVSLMLDGLAPPGGSLRCFARRPGGRGVLLHEAVADVDLAVRAFGH